MSSTKKKAAPKKGSKGGALAGGGDPNLTRGPMRTGTNADFHVDYDDGHNMQSSVHGHYSHPDTKRPKE